MGQTEVRGARVSEQGVEELRGCVGLALRLQSQVEDALSQAGTVSLLEYAYKLLTVNS